MKISTLKGVVSTFVTQPSVFLGKKNYIFVVSHMRSYSSLLCHILGSHREISGYAEMHNPYARRADLMRLRYRVYTTNNRQLEGRYILDKVLHNKSFIDSTILNLDNVKQLVMLRDPEHTMKSIINMGVNIYKGQNKWYADAEKVLTYYTDRLAHIQKSVTESKGDSLFFDAEKLYDDTEGVLNRLSTWLELATPLTPRYSKFENTGKTGYGDPSEVIKTGEIVRKGNDYGEIHIPSDILSQAKIAHEECRSILIQHADVI
jgi:hypothetical protein